MLSRKPRGKSVDQDETTITDLSIGPDGRIYVFGASLAVLEAIEAAGLGTDSLRCRLDRLRSNSVNSDQKIAIPINKSDDADRLD
jgi:hypothetical protein